MRRMARVVRRFGCETAVQMWALDLHLAEGADPARALELLLEGHVLIAVHDWPVEQAT
ncbi:hypothetical protein GCM10009696_34660 [Kocuria himachalensis]